MHELNYGSVNSFRKAGVLGNIVYLYNSILGRTVFLPKKLSKMIIKCRDRTKKLFFLEFLCNVKHFL